MLDGYKVGRFGEIRMINPPQVDYGEAYQKRLRERPLGQMEMNDWMAHLRLGYLTGSLGRLPYGVLDVGYGDGTFLKLCRKIGVECAGVEVNAENIPDGCTFVTDVAHACFTDVVCFFDSLEHFENLDFLWHLKCNYIYLTMPNCFYKSDEWFKNWKHRKPNEHIWHFGLLSITDMFEYYGYRMIAHSFIEDAVRGSGTDIMSLIFKQQ